jgi:hypothetical protein
MINFINETRGKGHSPGGRGGSDRKGNSEGRRGTVMTEEQRDAHVGWGKDGGGEGDSRCVDGLRGASRE